MNAAVCACGRKLEDDTGFKQSRHLFEELRTATHDPDECSRQVGFQGRFDGRREMALFAVAHLIERRTLGGSEIAEIRTNLLDAVNSLPLGKVAGDTPGPTDRGGDCTLTLHWGVDGDPHSIMWDDRAGTAEMRIAEAALAEMGRIHPPVRR